MAVRWGKNWVPLLGVACVVAGAGLFGGVASAPGGPRRTAASSSSASPWAARARTASADASSWPGGPVDPELYNLCGNTSDYVGGANGPAPASAYLAGWSDTSKLGQALPVGYPTPGLAETLPNSGVWTGGVAVDGVNYTCGSADLQLDDDGARQLPPATATFTGFGFMPITATAHLAQDGSAPIKLVFYERGSSAEYTVVASALMTLRISNVKVNGASLDVGDDCRTTGPLTSPDSPVNPGELVLSGGGVPGDPEPLDTLALGGMMAGLATIPAFTGCITPQGENLDPLLNATVSGPGNLIKLDQGPLCGSIGGYGSPPCVPGTSTAEEVPYWTISRGGPYSASGSFSLHEQTGVFATKFYQVTCNSKIAGDIPDMTGAPRGATGTFGWTFSGCAGESQTGADGTTWTIAQQSVPSLDLYTDENGVLSGFIWNYSFQLTGTGVTTATGTCTLQISGSISVTYADANSMLVPGGDNGVTPISNDCPEFKSNGNVVPGFSYTLSPGVQVVSP